MEAYAGSTESNAGYTEWNSGCTESNTVDTKSNAVGTIAICSNTSHEKLQQDVPKTVNIIYQVTQ